MKDRERELRETVRGLDAPDERGAEERAWRLVAAALEERPASERPGRARRRTLQAALALGLVALVASPAGASVRHWVAERVDPGVEDAKPVLGSLPGRGSLLVQSAQGPWVVRPDGARRRLGDYSESSWSPHGLYVVATTRHQLTAVEPDGTVRWTLDRRGPVRLARWNGPDGYRIAYLDGRSLRVVDGDGSDDRLLASGVPIVAPAWLPGPDHVLAYAAAGGGVRVIAADAGTPLFATPPGPGPVSLQWIWGDLLVVRPDGLRLYDGSGRDLWRWTAPRGTLISSSTAAPAGRLIAAVVHAGRTSRLMLVGPGRSPRLLFAGPGRFAAPQWSPRGGQLLLPWPSADQWLFLNPGGGPARLDAVANIATQFALGASPPAPFPRVVGWCCTR